MTVSITTRRNDYTGNGAVDEYAFSFHINASSELRVTIRDTDGVEELQVLTTDYTVDGVDDVSGGTITLVAGNLTNGYHLTIQGIDPLTQTTDIRNQGSYYPEVIEDTFDHLVKIDQQQQDQIDRCVSLPDTVDDSDFDPSLPAGITDAAGKVPIINDDSDGWADVDDWPDASGISGAAASAAAAAASAAAAAASAAQAATYAGSNEPNGINNASITASISSNNLIINLKQSDGSTDPTSGSGSSTIYFKSSTATSGQYVGRAVTAALGITVPDGGTLGHTSGLIDYIYVYAIDNAGTVELAVSSSNHWDEGSLVSTTAIGTGSDDAATMYSTSARTNVACRLIGRIIAEQGGASAIAEVSTVATIAEASQYEVTTLTHTGGNASAHNNAYFVLNGFASGVAVKEVFWFNFESTGSQPSVSGATSYIQVNVFTSSGIGDITGFLANAIHGRSAFNATNPTSSTVVVTNAEIGSVSDASYVQNGASATYTATVDTQGADGLNGKYFEIYDEDGKAVVWYDVSGSATQPTVSGANRYIEVTGVTQGMTANDVATQTQTTVHADSKFNATVSTNTVTITDTSGVLGARTDINAGTSGFTVAVQTQGQTLASNAWSNVSSICPKVNFKDDLRFSLAANFNAKHGCTYFLSTAAARSVQLPVPRLGWRTTVVDSTFSANSNNITFLRNGSEKINNSAASYVVSTNGAKTTLESNGTDWYLV